VAAGGSFNLNTWASTGSSQYFISAINGVLESSQTGNAIY
jgi:hypothetical protein